MTSMRSSPLTGLELFDAPSTPLAPFGASCEEVVPPSEAPGDQAGSLVGERGSPPGPCRQRHNSEYT